MIDLNLLFLSEVYYPHLGGAELATNLYAKRLTERGHKVLVLTHWFKNEAPVTRERNLTIIRMRLIDERSPKFSVSLKLDILKSSMFRKAVEWSDIVYIPRYWFVAIPFVRKLKKPVMVHLHDYIPICPLSNLYDYAGALGCGRVSCDAGCVWSAERTQGRNRVSSSLSMILNVSAGRAIGRLAFQADALICVSKRHRELLVERAPQIRDKVCFIYNPMPEVRSIPVKGEDFGYFGGVNALKGLRVLMDALRQMGRERRPSRVHATMIDSDELKVTLSRLGIVPYSRLSRKDFNDMYSSVQTVVVPSVWPEPLPYVVAEALTRGRLVIASRIGGIPELLEGCRGVYSFDPGDSLELAEAISIVEGTSFEDKLELGMQNREVFRKRFDDERSIDKFSDLCFKLVADN
jgi:glycosyltransferase involved in cell wall biosynthesis